MSAYEIIDPAEVSIEVYGHLCNDNGPELSSVLCLFVYVIIYFIIVTDNSYIFK